MRRIVLLDGPRDDAGEIATRATSFRCGADGATAPETLSAHALLERGYNVTVLDKHRYAAMETSFANGGQLSASNAVVWNGSATILKGLRWMFRRDAVEHEMRRAS